ncbi:hypothetical protein BS78_08G164000 [Paspalum vaginatum]|nr:hypothetical protein BS78_08G164000 [Paspalum vaginatum]
MRRWMCIDGWRRSQILSGGFAILLDIRLDGVMVKPDFVFVCKHELSQLLVAMRFSIIAVGNE